MFCPNCGTNNLTEQKFCRFCGMNLEQTVLSLLEQIPSAESAKLLRQEKNLEKFGTLASAGFGAVLLTGIGAIIYFIITKMILSDSNILGGIFLIAFLVFAVLLLAYVVFNENLKERKQKANSSLINTFTNKNETTKLLEEKHFESAASITENSTELLFVENKTRKLK